MDWLWRFLKGGDYLYPAVDIGTSSVKVVQSEKRGNSYKVKKYGVKEYKEQVFAGQEIIDEFELVRTIEGLFKELKIKDKKVVTHVPLNSCLYYVLSVPTTKEPEEAVAEYMQTVLSPEELPLVKTAYKKLPISIDKGHVDIAIAAVRREVIEQRIKILKRAGLEPVIIDIEPAAINNQFYLNNPEATATPTCLVDIGASYTKIIVSFGGYPYTTRNVEMGGNALTELLQRKFTLSQEEAEKLKRTGESKEVSSEDFKETVKEFARRILTEIEWTTERFEDQSGMEVEKIVLFGGTSKIEGFEDIIEELSVTRKKAEKGAPLSFSGLPDHEEFAVAAGLSLRYKGDENAKV